MRKTTLIFLAVAAALGGYIYYSEFRNVKEKPAEDAPKPLYTFASDDITSIQISRPGESAPITLVRGADGWTLTSPISTKADRRNADSVADALARVSSLRSLPADPARIKEFGLDPPAASVEIHLKSGPVQKIDFGGRDFSESNVYARQGGSKDVVLIPNSVLTEVARPVLELRDRSALALNNWSLTELDFHTPKAKFRVEKTADRWNMTEPRPAPADTDDVEGFKNALSAEKFSDVVEEDAHDASNPRYGFTTPEVTVHVRNEQGGEGTLLIGKKDGDKYFARDAARPMIFHVGEALFKKFSDASFTSLRDKHVLRGSAADFSHVSVRNEKTTMAATLAAPAAPASAAGSGQPGGAAPAATPATPAAPKWLVDEPADRKGKEFTFSSIIEPLINERAVEVMDPPSPAITAKLAKPAVELKLTDKKGGVITIVVSAKDGDNVYVRSSQSPAVFKFPGYILSQLNFAPEAVTQ